MHQCKTSSSGCSSPHLAVLQGTDSLGVLPKVCLTQWQASCWQRRNEEACWVGPAATAYSIAIAREGLIAWKVPLDGTSETYRAIHQIRAWQTLLILQPTIHPKGKWSLSWLWVTTSSSRSCGQTCIYAVEHCGQSMIGDWQIQVKCSDARQHCANVTTNLSLLDYLMATAGSAPTCTTYVVV